MFRVCETVRPWPRSSPVTQGQPAAIMPRMAALLALLTVLLASVLTASLSAAHPGGRRVSLLPDQLCPVG